MRFSFLPAKVRPKACSDPGSDPRLRFSRKKAPRETFFCLPERLCFHFYYTFLRPSVNAGILIVFCQSKRRQSRIISRFGPAVKEHPQDLPECVRMLRHKTADRADRDPGRLFQRIGVNPSGNRRKSDRADPPVQSDLKRIFIASRQKLRPPYSSLYAPRQKT